MKASNLKSEYLINPLGIDIQHPRLFWHCEGGVRQTAYRIVARTDGAVVWDSGKVESSSMHADYPLELVSRQRVEWSVRLWDEDDTCDENGGEPYEQAFFEMGLLNASDWACAKWITGNYHPSRQKRYPVDCFRFLAADLDVSKPIRRARVYATACGLYEIALNGAKVGDACLTPGYTDYNKRVQYQTYDVTENLKGVKALCLEVQLADGWYRGNVGAHGLACEFGIETKFKMLLEVEYEDGTMYRLGSNENWQWSNDGPIRLADLKDGEVVDARLKPSYCGRAKVTKHPVIPTASNNVPVKEMERFEGKVSQSPTGKMLVDFGQNHSGYIAFECEAEEGAVVRVRLGELIGEDGELTLKNIQTKGKHGPTPRQEVVYTCVSGKNAYKSRFMQAGHQFCEVTFEGAVKGFKIVSYAVYSSFGEIGTFESSNELLNRFVKATQWSCKSNSTDIPTDCPTRERHGWTGDAQIFFKSASYLFDYSSFAMKYLRDVYDWQKKNGRLPQIAPYGGVDFFMWVMNGSVGWSDIGILYPYHFWKMQGDERIIARYYERMRRYARFMERRCGRWGGVYASWLKVPAKSLRYMVNCGQSYGEWAEPQDVCKFEWWDFAAPHPEVSTAYTVYMMDLMAEIATALGKTEDLEEYRFYAGKCRESYRALVQNDPHYKLDTDRQAQLVRPLYLGLLDEKDTAFAKKRFLEALEHYGWRLGTGFLSTPFILKVLESYDIDACYRLLENEEIPGWLSMPKNGANTIWEAWEGAKAEGEVASLNHYSKGALCEWLFSDMCGIEASSENEFTITPHPGGHFEFANASYESVYGIVSAGWKRFGEGYRYEVTVPSNCVAHIVLPDGRSCEQGTGTRVY